MPANPTRRILPTLDFDGNWPAVVIASLSAALLVVFFLAEVVSGQARRLPMLAVALAVLGASQVMVPSARPSVRFPLSPRNWAIFSFLLQLVVIPVLLVVLGPVQSVLPYLPSDRSINEGLLLEVAAFVGFVLGLVLFGRIGSPLTVSGPLLWPPRLWTIAPLAVAGLIGMGLRFRSWQGLLDYVRFNPGSLNGDSATASASLYDAAATFLMPLLGFALILAWCNFIDTAPQVRRLRWWTLLVLLSVAVIMAYSVFRYERGPAFVAVICMLSVFSLRIQRIPYRALVAFAIVGMLVALLAGSLRSSVYTKVFGVGSGRSAAVSVSEANRQLQIYANGAQFAGFTIDMASIHHRLYLGNTIGPSLLYPVPVLGKPFRSSSGPAIYNRDIYGVPVFYDQILPWGSELYWNFSVPGVIIGFLIVGYVIAVLDITFGRSASALDAFASQYVGVWVAFLIIGSISVVSQMALYFMWPIAALYFIEHRRRDSKPKAGSHTIDLSSTATRSTGGISANPTQ